MTAELKLDHVFILTELNAPAADRLLELGFQESFGRVHAGQGTANRRFEFANGMLEFVWVHDAAEALHGVASGLQLLQRVTEKAASPFGVIVTANQPEPFAGWCYQPDYFPPPMSFHIGGNSELLTEPLCICSPVLSRKPQPDDPRRSLSHLKLTVPVKQCSEVLLALRSIEELEISFGPEHLMEVTFEESSRQVDLRPELPLVLMF